MSAASFHVPYDSSIQDLKYSTCAFLSSLAVHTQYPEVSLLYLITSWARGSMSCGCLYVDCPAGEPDKTELLRSRCSFSLNEASHLSSHQFSCSWAELSIFEITALLSNLFWDWPIGSKVSGKDRKHSCISLGWSGQEQSNAFLSARLD